jgi:hypothetical protein
MKIILIPTKYAWFILWYTFYIVCWKNLIKRIIRMITGTHEIERNVKKYKNYYEFSMRKLLIKLN